MRSAEFFSGAGGLALGIHLAGFEHQILADSDATACLTLSHNVRKEAVDGIAHWPVVSSRVEDLNLDGLEGLDLIGAGVPCQPFSNGGHKRGHGDERNMFPAFAGLIAKLTPRAFLLENVDGLASSDEGTLEYVKLQLQYPQCPPVNHEPWREHLSRLERLRKMGGEPTYNVESAILNAADYGVPQHRRRLFLVGFRRVIGVEWTFPIPSHSREALIHDQWVTGTYWDRVGARRALSLRPPHSVIERIESCGRNGEGAWTTLREAIGSLPALDGQADPDGPSQHDRIRGARAYHGHSGSPLDMPSKPLKAGVHGVPGGENMLVNLNGTVRYLTVREAARVQTFPDSWEFSGSRKQQTRQLGNAVPVELARVIASSIREALEHAD